MSEAKKNTLKNLEREYHRGQVVFDEGETSRELYILLEGDLEILKNGQSIAIIDKPDTYLGEMSTLLGEPRTATVKAVTNARLICVPEKKVMNFFGHSPQLAIKLATTLAKRLLEMNAKYEQVLRQHDSLVTSGAPAPATNVDVSGGVSSGLDGDDAPAEVSSAAQVVFEKLTSTKDHRELMSVYSFRVGREIPRNKVALSMNVRADHIDKILGDFAVAGLIEIVGENIRFKEAEDADLSDLILEWTPDA